MKNLYLKTLTVLFALIAGMLLTGCEPKFSTDNPRVDSGTFTVGITGGAPTNTLAVAKPIN